MRELKNIAEQISVLSSSNLVSAHELRAFLPDRNNVSRLPVLASATPQHTGEFANERKFFTSCFRHEKDVTELKKMFLEILQNPALAAQAANYTSESLMNDYPVMSNELPKQVNAPASMQPAFIQPVQAGAQPVLLPHEEDIHQHVEVESR